MDLREQRTALHHRGNQSRIEESSYKSLCQKHCRGAFTYPAVIGFHTIHSEHTLQLSTTSSFCKNCEVLAIQYLLNSSPGLLDDLLMHVEQHITRALSLQSHIPFRNLQQGDCYEHAVISTRPHMPDKKHTMCAHTTHSCTSFNAPLWWRSRCSCARSPP